MKAWGALLVVGLSCAPALAAASASAPQTDDLIGLLLDDPIGFALSTSAAWPADMEASALAEDVADTVAAAPEPPAEPSRSHAELAARAFDITYTFAHPDSVRRAGADR